MAKYYNRYSGFDLGVSRNVVPFLEVGNVPSDIYITFKKSSMRLDMLSYKYYGDPDYGWLLMLANPQYGYYEYLIPDGVQFRIPYPLSLALSKYEESVSKALKN